MPPKKTTPKKSPMSKKKDEVKETPQTPESEMEETLDPFTNVIEIEKP
jgi:hypothetical protein